MSAPLQTAPREYWHGQLNGYTWRCCRCVECRAAQAAYQLRKVAERKSRGQCRSCSADAVAPHVWCARCLKRANHLGGIAAKRRRDAKRKAGL